MRPVFQDKFGAVDAPGVEQGNCFQASLASILELSLSDVPHFVGLWPDDDWVNRVDEWLLNHFGLYLLYVTPTNAQNEPLVPFGFHLMGGPERASGIPHSVVGYQGMMIHDPNPVSLGLREVESLGLLVSAYPNAIRLRTPEERIQ